MKIVSKKQARFLGFIAGGGKPKGGRGPTASKAHKMLAENRGMKLRELPTRVKSRQSSRRRPSR